MMAPESILLKCLQVKPEFAVECYCRQRSCATELRPFDGAYLSEVDLGDGRSVLVWV